MLVQSTILVIIPHELPNDLRHLDLKKLENIRKISNLGGHIVYCPVYFQQIRL